jgi:hypothetical protein
VGIDCHSKFFKICVLVPQATDLTTSRLVDLEVEVNVFADRNGVTHHRLRICSRVGEF